MNLLDVIVRFDHQVMSMVVGLRNPVLTKLMNSVTGLGGVFATVSLLYLFYLAGWKREFVLGSFSHILNGLLVSLLMFSFSRPFPSDPVCVTSSGNVAASFPSGHAASAMIFSFVAWKSDNIPFLPVFISAILVAISRVYLGTHYLSDTVFGVVMGLGVAYLGYSTDRTFENFYDRLETVFQAWKQ